MEEISRPAARAPERAQDALMGRADEAARLREPSSPPIVQSQPQSADAFADALHPFLVQLGGQPGISPPPGSGISSTAPYSTSKPSAPSSASSPRVDLNLALSYIEMIKARFENWPHVFEQILDIMKDFKSVRDYFPPRKPNLTLRFSSRSLALTSLPSLRRFPTSSLAIRSFFKVSTRSSPSATVLSAVQMNAAVRKSSSPRPPAPRRHILGAAWLTLRCLVLCRVSHVTLRFLRVALRSLSSLTRPRTRLDSITLFNS